MITRAVVLQRLALRVRSPCKSLQFRHEKPKNQLEAQDRLRPILKSWLAKNTRRVKLPELLIEVDSELRFTRHFFTTARAQKRCPRTSAPCWPWSRRTAWNLGADTMAQLTPDVTYEQLKRISDWQLTRRRGGAPWRTWLARSPASTPLYIWSSGRAGRSMNSGGSARNVLPHLLLPLKLLLGRKERDNLQLEFYVQNSSSGKASP